VVFLSCQPPDQMKQLSFFDKLLFILSVYVVIELYISSIVNYPNLLETTLLVIDTIICILFIYGFFSGLINSDNKLKYFKYNWIDLASSIPMIGILRIGRIVRVIRVLRVLRTGKILLLVFNRKNPLSTFKNIALIILFIIILFSISFYQIEKDYNPNINSILDSFWWTTITTITIGFLQDISPITLGGKFFSVILILLGMILFGTFISTVTDYFIEEEETIKGINSISNKIDKLDKRMEEIENLIRNLKPKK